MSERAKIADVKIDIRIEDLLGPLGYTDSSGVKPSIMDQIVSETERCIDVMTGKAIYRRCEFSHGRGAIEVDGKSIEDETLQSSLEGASALAVAVCTVGPKIDEIVSECFDRGDYFTGMIADVVGARAVEDVAHKCVNLICADAGELALSVSGRISPGYGKWDTSGQRPLFELLDPSPIGVSLNEHCMMEPKKSISFVAPLAPGEPGHVERPPCLACDFKDCAYRRK